MKLPEVKDAPRYAGLYVVDFGDHCGVGFTAQEVAELLESERFANVRAYRITRGYPDGRLELRGVRPELFQLESGMVFHAHDEATARADYKGLVALAVRLAPPGRAKVQLAKLAGADFATVLIYPAEMDEDFSAWLLEGDYRTAGSVEGGVEAVTRYYRDEPQVIERHQLWERPQWASRSGHELFQATAMAVQR